MKILFLEIETDETWGLASVGPGYIGSYLRKHGHEAALFRVLPDAPIAGILWNIKNQTPDIIGFSLTTRQWLRAAFIAREIRKKMNTPVIAGGLHATFAPLSFLESDGFDYVCIGEGEEAMLDLLSCLEKGDKIRDGRISNIWVKGGGRPVVRPPFESIDKIPFLARDLIDEKHGVIHLLTQRGCPFSCSFCAASSMVDLYKNATYIRKRSVDNVIEELRQIRQEGPLNYVVFLDDTFTTNRAWVEAFCRVYGREIGTGFSINARVETVNHYLIDLLADAGCRHIVYGVESGSTRVRRDILNRPVENQLFVDVFNWTKQANIMVTANYMIGLPGETPEDIDQTLSLNNELDPDDFGCFVFYPYPGTRLFQVCRQNGFLPDNWIELPSDNRQSILNMPNLSKGDILHYYNIFAKARENTYSNQYGDTFIEEKK